MRRRVLIIGGYGVFGGRLARRLSSEPDIEVIVAGRRLAAAQAFCGGFGGVPCRLDRDRDGDLEQALGDRSPDLVIDAAGPFQAYGTDPLRTARTVITAGIHYLDLADDRDFVSGIVALDDLAKEREACAIAGASSVPGLSSAAADALAAGLAPTEVIETVIVPGNRAPRGLSVVQAILAQVGRPLRVWRGGRWAGAAGWGGLTTVRLSTLHAAPLRARWASLIGVPDCDLFPARYGASTVLFRAGLELRLLHGGLWLLGWLVRIGLIRTLIGYAGPLKFLADRSVHWGTDRGGMSVHVIGRDRNRRACRRGWTLVVEAGDGPEIPAVPAAIVARKILAGAVAPGARPCLGLFSLDEAAIELASLAVDTHRDEQPAAPLFERALGDSYWRLPAPVRDLHEVFDRKVFGGMATVERGAGWLAGVYAAIAGFPKAGRDIPVSVSMTRHRTGERWVRTFGRHRFRSHLRRRPSDAAMVVWERFGLLSMEIVLQPDDDGLNFPVHRARLLGLPLPRFVIPLSQTRESVGPSGQVQFDVAISLPNGKLVVRYTGTLAADHPSGM